MKQRETETSRTFTWRWKNSLKAVLSRLLLSSLLLSFSFCFKHLEISPVLKRRADGNSSFDLAFPERTRGHPSCLTHLATPDLQGACSVASGPLRAQGSPDLLAHPVGQPSPKFLFLPFSFPPYKAGSGLPWGTC